MGIPSSRVTVTFIISLAGGLRILKLRNVVATNLYPVNPMEVMLRVKAAFAAEKEAVLFQSHASPK